MFNVWTGGVDFHPYQIWKAREDLWCGVRRAVSHCSGETSQCRVYASTSVCVCCSICAVRGLSLPFVQLEHLFYRFVQKPVGFRSFSFIVVHLSLWGLVLCRATLPSVPSLMACTFLVTCTLCPFPVWVCHLSFLSVTLVETFSAISFCFLHYLLYLFLVNCLSLHSGVSSTAPEFGIKYRLQSLFRGPLFRYNRLMVTNVVLLLFFIFP